MATQRVSQAASCAVNGAKFEFSADMASFCLFNLLNEALTQTLYSFLHLHGESLQLVVYVVTRRL